MHGIAASSLRALVVTAVLLALWQVIVVVFRPPSFMLPPPLDVARMLVERPDLWQQHAVTTLIETVAGLALGATVGIVLALAISLAPGLRQFLLPTMAASQAVPVFALAPILTLWLGFGMTSKVVMAAVAIFFPVASAFADGLARVDQGLIDLARLNRARPWQVVLLIRVPGAMPGLATGLRLAAVYAPVGAMIGEWAGASSGLGYAMLLANARAQTDVMFAALLLLAAMAIVLRAFTDMATARLVPWAAETR